MRLPIFKCLLVSFVLVLSASAEDDKCVSAQKKVRQGVALADGSDAEIELYKAAIAECENVPEAHYDLALALIKQGKYVEASSSLEQALALDKKDEFVLALAETRFRLDDLDGALRLYRELNEKNSQSVKPLQGMANVFAKQGDLEKALDALNEALTISASDAVSLNNKALILERLGRKEAALEAFSDALRADPSNYEATLNLAQLNQELGRYEAAASSYNKATVLKPDSVEAYKALGVVYEKLQDFERAELAFRKALKIDDSDAGVYSNLAVMMIKNRKEPYAEELLSGVVDKFPNNARILSVLGWAELSLGRYPEAEKHILESLKLDPDNKAAHNNLAIIYERTNRKEEASNEFKKAE